MLYFSELTGKRVFTHTGVYVGVLKDLLFRYADIPLITHMVVDNQESPTHTVTIASIKTVENSVIIQKKVTSALEKDELSVAKTLLDKQVIDLVGNKVVRVNDVALNDTPNIYVAGIDISFLGLLRRIGLAHMTKKFARRLHRDIREHLLSWSDIQDLEMAEGKIKLKKREEKLAQIPPEDLADYLEMTNTINARRFLKKLPTEQAAEVLENLNINYQTALFADYEPETATRLIQLMDPDEAADILLTLQKTKREKIMALLPAKKHKELTHLLSLASTPMGEILTTEYLTVNPSDTVSDVVRTIKEKTQEFSSLHTVYVLNEEQKLVGVFTLQELLLQENDAQVVSFMVQNPNVVHLTSPIELVAKKMLRYQLHALPVIDQYKHMIGLVTLDDISEYLLEKVS
jgi:magnesium transporter